MVSFAGQKLLSLVRSYFSLCSSIHLTSCLTIFRIMTLNSFSCRLPVSTSISSSRVFSFFHLEHVLPVASFCLICCFYFSVCGRLVMFLRLIEVALCRKSPVCPCSALPSHHPSYMLSGFPLRELCGSFCCGRLSTWVI